MVGDVDQQILLEERLDLGQVLDTGGGLAGGGGEGLVGDDDARLVVVGDDVLGELTELRRAEGLLVEELDPDGTAVGRRLRVCGGGKGSVLSEHRVGWAGRELEFPAAVGCINVSPCNREVGRSSETWKRAETYLTEPSEPQYSSRKRSSEILTSSSASSYSCFIAFSN